MPHGTAETTEDKAWQDYANCLGVDPDLFFPVGTTEEARSQVEDARAVCLQCAVRPECLAWALST